MSYARGLVCQCHPHCSHLSEHTNGKSENESSVAFHAFGKHYFSTIRSYFIHISPYLQDKSQKYIHYVDSAVKFPIRAGLEDLPERIEVAQIAEIGTGTGAVPPNVLRDTDLPTPAPVASPLSFSLYSTRDGSGSLADQVATDTSRWADWTDGLNMLRRDGGHVATQETAGFVHALTEIGLKIKLLSEWSHQSFYWYLSNDLYLIFLRSLRRESGNSKLVGRWSSSADCRLFLCGSRFLLGFIFAIIGTHIPMFSCQMLRIFLV